MADKAIPDISLGGAEQNMSREELAAVAKAVAALSPEDRDRIYTYIYWSPPSG